MRIKWILSSYLNTMDEPMTKEEVLLLLIGILFGIIIGISLDTYLVPIILKQILK